MWLLTDVILWIENTDLCAIMKGSVIQCSQHYIVSEIIQMAYNCGLANTITYVCQE